MLIYTRSAANINRWELAKPFTTLCTLWEATNRFFSGASIWWSSLGFIDEPIQLCRHLKCAVSQRLYSQRWDGLVAENALQYSRTCVTHSDVISPDVLLLSWSVFKVQQYRLLHWSWAVGNWIWSTAKIICGVSNSVPTMTASVQRNCNIPPLPLLGTKYPQRIQLLVIKYKIWGLFQALQDLVCWWHVIVGRFLPSIPRLLHSVISLSLALPRYLQTMTYRHLYTHSPTMIYYGHSL